MALPGPPEASTPYKGHTGVRRIVLAFFNSLAGLAAAWRHESAFRQEVALVAVLLPAAFLLPVSWPERALLVAVTLLVPIVELLNTGVEVAIDRISFDPHSLSKRAKDIGSAAVFLSLVLAAFVWAIVLLGCLP